MRGLTREPFVMGQELITVRKKSYEWICQVEQSRKGRVEEERKVRGGDASQTTRMVLTRNAVGKKGKSGA